MKLFSDSEIFKAAVQLAPARRSAFLDEACGDNRPLRDEVESLLRAHDPDGSFLKSPVPEVTIDRPISERPGSIIGPYKLVEQIGEGGFGVVFMARQTEPVKRLVAIKVVKPGMDSRQVIARFEAERQALALMDHPNIAKVLDAGTTDGGRPYFVMELVKGVPITRYCDEQHLTPRQRLKLLVPVCQAIQHAHHKGIIHRDLKPSNVLIALYDDKPVPKVIDFGVAKATGQQLTEQTLHTGFGAVVGTVEYMSPEQASFNQLDVDTRSDVYSLGVLLYELLTGSTPFSRKELEKVGMLEMLRVIREQEPARPSTKLSTAEGLPTLAANRGSEPAKLTRLVRGELDWIVMKALEKDRSRRYESASGLARDLERYLADEQVQACPPSAAYRLRKFVRRNKRALATASLAGVLLLVALGTVAGSIGWLVRDQEARRTKLAGQLELILEEVRKQEAEQKWPEALAAARRAEALVAGGGGDAALEKQNQGVLADLTLVQRLEEIWLERATPNPAEGVGHAWTDQAYAEAFRKYGLDLKQCSTQQAIEFLRPRPVAEALAAWLDHWADCLRRLGDDAGSRKLWMVAGELDSDPWRKKLRVAMIRNDPQAVEAIAESTQFARQPASSLLLLSAMLSRGEKSEREIEVLRQAQRLYPGDFWLNTRLGQRLNLKGQPKEAVGYCRVAVALRPTNHLSLLYLAYSLEEVGELDEAIACYKQAIELKPNDSQTHTRIGNVLGRQNKLDEAIACIKKAIEVNPKDSNAYYSLGIALKAQDKLDEAIAAYRRAIEFKPRFAEAHVNLGIALRKQTKLGEAIACYHKAIEIDPKLVNAHNNLGFALAAQKKFDEAIACYQKAIELDPKYAHARFNLGIALAAQNKLDEAIACYRKAIEINPQYADAHYCLGNALMAQDKLGEASAAYRKAIECDPKLAEAHVNLGNALRRQDELDEAIECYRQAINTKPKLVQAYLGLGAALTAQKKPDEAIAALRKALELDPNLVEVHYNLGVLLAALEKPDEAVAAYCKAIELNPEFWQAYHNLGLVINRQKKVDEAIAAFRKATELNPASAESCNSLAWILATCADPRLRNPAEALALAKKAVELDPKNPHYPSTLGAALYDPASGKPPSQPSKNRWSCAAAATVSNGSHWP